MLICCVCGAVCCSVVCVELCVELLCVELCVDLLCVWSCVLICCVCVELCVDLLCLLFGLVWMETSSFCCLQRTSQNFDLPGGGVWV